MSVSREQADAMGALISAMNAATGDGEVGSKATPSVQSPASKGDACLSSIMEGFRNATDDALEGGNGNTDFAEALETEVTETGVRVGSWKIDVHKDEGFGKFYNISHTITNEPIASDLRLYEAAYGIVKALNEGETFTSGRVKAIVDLERDYARALADAVNFSSRMKITEGMKHDVAEARYSEARRQALAAKNAIKKLSK